MLGWIQRWLQDLLTQVIGPFVEVPSESLQFSLRNGRVFMSDVVLRTRQIESSLASGLGLQMPVAIKRGKVSHLQLQIPWMNLIYGKIVLSPATALMLLFLSMRTDAISLCPFMQSGMGLCTMCLAKDTMLIE